MKKCILILLALTMMSTSAFASKARLLALGESKDDASYYIDDNRRTLTNAAFINKYTDYTLLEWGSSAGGTAGLDLDTNPKAEGGFYKKVGNLNYGLFLGNENDTVVLFHTVAGLSNTQPARIDNVLQLMVGGEAGVNWGAGFIYATNEKKTTGTDKYEMDYMAVRLGADGDNWDGFANVSLKNDAKEELAAAPVKFEGKLGLHVGGGADVGPGRVFVSAKKGDWDQTLSGTKTEGAFSYHTAGYGVQHDMGEKGTLFCKLAYEKTSVELKYAASKTEFDHMIVPLTFAYEKEANSWLTLRGSISQNLTSKAEAKNLSNIPNGGLAQTLVTSKFSLSDNTEKTIGNSANVSAGATLTFGKLNIDGVIGSHSATNAASETGILHLDNLMARTAVTYSF